MASFALASVEDMAAWSRFLERSPQRTRYCDPAWVDLFDDDCRYWFLERNGTPVLAFLQASCTRTHGAFLPYCYYQGPMFSDEVWRSAPPKRTQYEIEFAETALGLLTEQEERFGLSLHPSLLDVRGYDWLHYHEPAKGRVRLQPRYTAIVDVADVPHADLRAAARSARRQEEGYATKRHGLTFCEDGSAEEMLALAHASFARQDLSLPADDAASMQALSDGLLAQGCGRFVSVRDEHGAALAIALLMEDFDGTEHVPLVGTGSDRFAGTLLYFGILDSAQAHGRTRVDFNGANSPKRGYFKHSIGARPVLFFEAHWQRPAAVEA